MLLRVQPPGIVFTDLAEAVEAVVGLDEAFEAIDGEDRGGVDGAVAEVGVAHYIAGEAGARLQIAEAVVDDAADHGPVFDADDGLVVLVHGCVT